LSKHQARWEYNHGRRNVTDPLSKNPFNEKWIILTLLIICVLNCSFQIVVADTTRSASMEMTNARKNFHGFDNEFFDKIIAGYVLDPWFKDPVNL
jgi:hypothetical protein